MRAQRTSPAQRAEVDAIFAKCEAENKARYVNEPAPTEAATTAMAAFLRGWARGRAITKYGGDGNSFWACGRNMTKLSPKEIDALVAVGHATRDGNVLRMNKS